jgi:hypothetical protein
MSLIYAYVRETIIDLLPEVYGHVGCNALEFGRSPEESITSIE